MLLKQARMLKGLAQGQLVSLAETTQAVISDLENGRRFSDRSRSRQEGGPVGHPI